MPSFFRKRRQPYNLRNRRNTQSTPAAKVDTCVECDLPFDESKIAPELRRGPVTREETSPETSDTCDKNFERFNKTNLEPVDISIDSNSEDSLSVLVPLYLSSPTDTEEGNHLENEKQKRTGEEDFTENSFATGGQQVPVSTSPVNSNERTPNAFSFGGLQTPITTARADYSLIGQQEPQSISTIDGNNISSGQPLSPIDPPADIDSIFSRNICGRGSPNSDTSSTSSTSAETGSSTDSDSVDESSLNIMEGEYIRALTELTQKLLSKDVNVSKFHG